MILSSIAAMSSNRVIGKDGGLPWKIPEDTKFFRDMTMGHIMLMGRKTFDSLGKPLPGRLHVILTRQKDFAAPAGTHLFHDVKEALTFCESQTPKWGEEVFLVGGAEMYRLLLPQTDRIYLTEIDAEFEGDAYFPTFSADEFSEVSRRTCSAIGLPDYHFVTYER